LERGRIGDDVGAIENLENLELIDFELKIGFGAGFVKLKMLKKVLLIPTYKEEVRLFNFNTGNVVMGVASKLMFMIWRDYYLMKL